MLGSVKHESSATRKWQNQDIHHALTTEDFTSPCQCTSEHCALAHLGTICLLLHIVWKSDTTFTSTCTRWHFRDLPLPSSRLFDATEKSSPRWRLALAQEAVCVEYFLYVSPFCFPVAFSILCPWFSVLGFHTVFENGD